MSRPARARRGIDARQPKGASDSAIESSDSPVGTCDGRDKHGPECWRAGGCHGASYIAESKRVMRNATLRAKATARAVREQSERAPHMSPGVWESIALRKVVVRGTRVDVAGPDSPVSRDLTRTPVTVADREADKLRATHVVRAGKVAEQRAQDRVGGLSDADVRRELIEQVGWGAGESLVRRHSVHVRRAYVAVAGTGQRVQALGGDADTVLRAMESRAADYGRTPRGVRGRVTARSGGTGAKGTGRGRERAIAAIAAADRGAEYGGPVEAARVAAKAYKAGLVAGVSRDDKRALRARMGRLARVAGLDPKRLLSSL